MAIKFNRSQTFATNGTVTAAGLHNLIDGTDIYQALITDQTAMTSVGSLDKLLIADSDLTAADAPRSVTVNELFEDALTLSTYTNANAVNLKYTSATGNYTLSTGATITNGTITNGTITNGTITNGMIQAGTFGTTTSTAATITNGTIERLTASTANISQGSAILTQGTVATLNSTTGTIGNLSATTSTFLGTITGSTNVINIGSGQIYKDASGNVGIGAASPIRKLSVEGGGLGFQDAGGGNRSITWNDTTSTNLQLAIQGNSTTGNCFLAFLTNTFGSTAVERFRIASSGQLGIGGANYGTNGQVLTSGGDSAAPSWQTASPITSGTAVASTSGTAIDFTGIPIGVKRITVMFNGVSTNGVSAFLIQIGSGSMTTSGYSSSAANFATPTVVTSSTGFILVSGNVAAATYNGHAFITNSSGSSWVETGSMFPSGGNSPQCGGGNVTLSGDIDRLRIRTENGTDTFDAGLINILYEK